MPAQVIVPHRPGPLIEVPEESPEESGPHSADGRLKPFDLVLTTVGAALLVAVAVGGLPPWAVLIAVGCLALGLGLPAQVALATAARRRAGNRARRVRERGTPLDVTHTAPRRLVAAYRRAVRTAGDEDALSAAHLILVEVADRLGGRAPDDTDEERYVSRRAEEVSSLADRLTEPGAS